MHHIDTNIVAAIYCAIASYMSSFALHHIVKQISNSYIIAGLTSWRDMHTRYVHLLLERPPTL